MRPKLALGCLVCVSLLLPLVGSPSIRAQLQDLASAASWPNGGDVRYPWLGICEQALVPPISNPSADCSFPNPDESCISACQPFACAAYWLCDENGACPNGGACESYDAAPGQPCIPSHCECVEVPSGWVWECTSDCLPFCRLPDGSAGVETLYGLARNPDYPEDYRYPNPVVQIDKSSGASNGLNTSGGAWGQALAFDSRSGLLYAAGSQQIGTSYLSEVTPFGGTWPRRVDDVGWLISGLAIDPADGTLYARTQGTSATSPDCLIRLDKGSGAAEIVAPITMDGVGMVSEDSPLDFDPLTGILHGTVWNDSESSLLMHIDIETGEAEVVTEISLPGVRGIAFDSEGVLYAVIGEPSKLYAVERNTGGSTEIGPILIDHGYYSLPSTLHAIDFETESPPSMDDEDEDTDEDEEDDAVPEKDSDVQNQNQHHPRRLFDLGRGNP